jgi:hypothetical protein
MDPEQPTPDQYPRHPSEASVQDQTEVLRTAITEAISFLKKDSSYTREALGNELKGKKQIVNTVNALTVVVRRQPTQSTCGWVTMLCHLPGCIHSRCSSANDREYIGT